MNKTNKQIQKKKAPWRGKKKVINNLKEIKDHIALKK